LASHDFISGLDTIFCSLFLA